MLYNKDCSVLYFCPYAFAPTDGAITLASTLTSIGQYAFANCTGVKTIAFADGASVSSFSIGSNAFQNATNLSSFALPSGLKTIAANTFSGCESLKKIVVPNTVTLIQAGAFAGCTGLEEVEFEEGGTEALVLADGSSSGGGGWYSSSTTTGVFSSYTSGGRGGYPWGGGGSTQNKSCTSLKKVAFPKRLTQIGAYAFAKCTALQEVTFGDDSDLETIGAYAFRESGLQKIGKFTTTSKKVTDEDGEEEEVFYTTSTLPAKLKTIGESAFYSVSFAENTTLVIPASVESFGGSSPQYGVFYQGGSNLKSVVFEDGSKLTKVPQNAFMATQGLESVDFGDNGALDEIAYNAFYTCRQLKSVDFGENGKLRVIGKSAFAYTALESISIPATVEIVGDPSISYGYGVFAGCEKLTAVTFETYADGDNKGKSSLETICEGAFQNTALTSFTFPSTIKGLAAGTSGGLGKGLFSGCTKLTEITLSDTVTDLSDVFTGCSSIEKISGDNANYTFEDHILYGVSEGKKTEIVMLIGNLSTTEGTLTIADGITKIGASVFAGRADVKKLVLPASLTTIGENTFKDCVGLQEVTFAENCALNSIGASAFKNCISLKSISLPSGVTALEDNTFYHCSSLTSVKMPGVTRIGSEPDESSWSVPDSNVFAFCSSLSTIDLKNVTTIGKRSFEKCVSLTDIDLSSATEIGEAEFIGCSSLESVKVGDGLTSIPASAFQNCSKLKYFGIIVDKTKDPIVDLSSVTSIDNGAFVNNSSITEVKLSANEGFTELSASLFKGCTSLAYVNKTNTGTEEKPVYTSYLPNQLTTLGNEAFADSALTSVRIPDGVTAIGYDSWNISYATGRTFAGCTKLTDLDLNNVTIICAESFIDCPLTNVKDTLLSKVQWFGKGSFARTGLKTADLSGVKTTYNSWGVQTPMGFEDGSFGSYNLSHSDYSDGVFEDCKSLASVIFSSDTEDVTIGGSTVSVNIQLGKAMFKGCTALTSVTLTKGVTSLAGGTFYGCSNLEKVNVDENGEISNVGSYTFGNCVKLGSFDISKVGSLSEGLFDGCEKLTTVTMNYGVNSIPAYVFRNCKALTSIDFTQFSGVSSIGESAFEGCSSLTGHLKLPKGQSQPTYDESTGEFTWKIGTYSVGENAFKGTGFASLYVSASVSSIGEDAFAECKNLTGIEVDAENKYFATGEDDGWLYDLDLTEIVLIPSGYNPEGNVLTLTGDMTLTANALNSCPNITKVVLDESITSVPEDLFKGSLYVKEVVLSSKTTSIGMHAFANSSVEKISYTGYTGDSAGEKTAVLPETVTSISSYAFLGSKIEKVVADGLTSIGTGAFANSALKQITYSDYVAEEGETLLVSSFKNLTSISGSAFRGTKLEKVILPASTRSVNSGAFANSELQSIVFSADNISFYYQNETVYGFGYPGVFENCAKLSNVTFGKDQGSLDDRMFCGCSSLASITIPEKVTSLGGYMFYGCSNLASVTLPANLRSIGEYAFYGCAFTSIKIPEGVTNISAHAFENCSNLTSIDVPASARWLYYTFVNCTSLETVVLHEGLDTLGQSVFEGCTALKNITLPSTLKTIQNFVFNDCTSLKSIVLPASLTTVYFSFENWTSDQTIYIEASDMQVYGTWSGNSNGSYDSFMQQTSDNSDYRKFGATIVWNYKAPASESDSESATDSSESAATDSSESDES